MILGVLQARMSSSRLPGKVLLPLAGAPMILRQIERVLRAERLDALVVATSDQADDIPLAEVVERSGTAVFRGSLDDVLDRFYRAASPHCPSHVVRLTGDCPLTDWTVLDAAVDLCLGGGYDYVSNGMRPTWPDGLDVEVLRFAALETAWREASSPVEREHVTPFIYRRPERFRLASLENGTDLSALRWTVDEPADYAFVRAVYDGLYPADPAFETRDVLALMQRSPSLQSLNSGIKRNEGLRRSEEKLAAGQSE